MSVSKIVAAAASSAGGGAGLDVDSVFSTFLYDGTGATQVIENGIALSNANDGGSARFDGTKGLVVADHTGFQFGTGNWTIEAYIYPTKDDNFVVCSWGESSGVRWDFGWQSSSNPRILVNTSSSSQTSTASSTPISGYVGQWVHIACVRNGSDIVLYVGGVAKTTMSYTGTSFPNPSTAGVNIGTRFYTGQNNVNNSSFGFISDFRIVKGTAVYTSNFTPSTSALTAVSGTSFLGLSGDTPLVDASGNSHSISQNSYNSGDVAASGFGRLTGSSGEGGLVWIKRRSGTSDHNLFDNERGFATGGTGILSSNTTGASNDFADYFNATSTGFTLLHSGNDTNDSSSEYVSWTFRKAKKFFDVVKITGTGGGNRAINHALGQKPGMIIGTRYDASSEHWHVYHRSLDGGNQPATHGLRLNSDAAEGDESSYWEDTEPTSTQFTVGNNQNHSGGSHIFYLFAHNDSGDGGFGPDSDQDIIKCSSYTGGTTGTEVNVGFEPQFVMIKRASGTGDWMVFDAMRGVVSDPYPNLDNTLFWNLTNAERTNTGYIGFTPTGFIHQGGSGDTNTNGDTYVYMAIRRGPLAAPTDATKVFAIDTRSSSDGEGKYTSGFPVDFSLANNYDQTGNTFAGTRLTNAHLQTNSTVAEGSSATDYQWDHNDGLGIGMTGAFFGGSTNNINFMWKRSPSYFDVVAYTGTGSARTVAHNLGVVPEMFWVKSRDSTESWAVFHKNIGNGFQTVLNQANVPLSDSTSYNNTDPTSSVFTVGTNDQLNKSGDNYIAYLFATVDGLSKLGTCSHTFGGGNTNVDCGFSNGCRFLLIKSTTHAYPWEVYDSVRGIVSGNDPYLKLNNTDAEVTNNDGIDPLSSGFTLTSTGWNTGTYIFYAIA
jgi:hypothetical protein